MARTPASDGIDGVGKSGSPAPRSITSSPAALRRFASCEIAMVADVSRCCRLGDRPEPGGMRGTIAARGEVGNCDHAVAFRRRARYHPAGGCPLTTEDRVTGAEGKAALERGRGVVLVCPPAPERAQQLWELVSPLTAAEGPAVGPLVLIVCADDAAAAEWPAVAPVGVRVHAVTGLLQSASRLKQRPPQVLAGAVKDLAALVQRAALKLDRVAALVVAWPEAVVAGEHAAALDTLLGEAREARRLVLSWNPALLADLLERHARRPLVVGTLPVDGSGAPLAPAGRVRYCVVPSARRPAVVRDVLDALDAKQPAIWSGGPHPHSAARPDPASSRRPAPPPSCATCSTPWTRSSLRSGAAVLTPTPRRAPTRWSAPRCRRAMSSPRWCGWASRSCCSVRPSCRTCVPSRPWPPSPSPGAPTARAIAPKSCASG